MRDLNHYRNRDGAINFTTTVEIDTVGDIFTIANR